MGKTEVFAADFTLLQNPDAIIQAARDIVSAAPFNVRQLHTFRLMIPTEVLAQTKSGGPYGQLIVPVDEQLRKHAIEFLKSESFSRRLEAAEALRYFKSKENIDRLRTLLEDEGYSQRTASDGTASKYFGVRDAAYQTLQAWGIEVERPVIVQSDSHQID